MHDFLEQFWRAVGISEYIARILPLNILSLVILTSIWKKDNKIKPAPKFKNFILTYAGLSLIVFLLLLSYLFNWI